MQRRHEESRQKSFSVGDRGRYMCDMLPVNFDPNPPLRSDPRIEAASDPDQWRDGICLVCNSPMLQSDALSAQPDCPNFGDRARCDYFCWCSNPECIHFAGECVGDQQCPPDWAIHDKRN
jgi:hypothetical protein